MLKDYYTYDELLKMPLKKLIEEIELFSPRFKEIAKRQQQERLKAELENKRNANRPRGNQDYKQYYKTR